MLQPVLWREQMVPRISKSRMRGRAFSYQAPLCGTSSQFGFVKQTSCLPLTLVLVFYLYGKAYNNGWLPFLLLLFFSKPGVMGLVDPFFLSNPVEADGRPSRARLCWRFLPVKRELFLSTVTLGVLRTGDWFEENIWCDLLVSLATHLFINLHFMNWTPIGLDFNKFDWRIRLYL